MSSNIIWRKWIVSCSRSPKTTSSSACNRSQKRKDSSSRRCNSRAEYPSGGANAPPSANFLGNNQVESFVAPPYASVSANDQHDHFMQISTVDNGYTSPGAPCSLTTLPQSSKAISLPPESSEGADDSNVHIDRTSRRIRTRATGPVEEPRNVNHQPNARKTRKKH